MRSPPVSVVLVHWDQPDRCVDAVDAFLAQEGAEAEVCVVDNGPPGEAQDRLRDGLAGRALLRATGANLGFGPGANVGLRWWLEERDTEWVVVAPHDAVPAADCLARMLAALGHRRLAGLACADVGDGHTPVIDPYFGGLTVPGDPWAPAPDGWERAAFPHGTFLMARRACIAEIGPFDERYFAYCEEADLGARATKAGWEVGLVRGARVTNGYLGGGSDTVDYLKLRNTLLFVREHHGAYRAAVRRGIGAIQLLDGLLRPAARPELFAPAARARALADDARRRYGPPY